MAKVPELPPNIEDILKEYEQQTIDTLTSNAAAAHAAGDLKAQAALNIKLSFDLVNQEAAKFAKAYRNQLVKEGGCVIQGKFVPWLKDRSAEDRARIAEIIRQGYLQGTPTGVKQYGKPGKYGFYPDNTIAGQLQEYFNVRKSHASTVARTEIARIQHTGSMNRYKQQGVKKGLWLVFNPCPVCSPLGRRVFELGRLPYEIPVHPNCRCALAPVPDDVPNGPAPDQEIPPVFETQAKAQPFQPPGEAIQTINHDRVALNDGYPSENWTAYYTRATAPDCPWSEGEIDALENYIGSGYYDHNRWLRLGDKKFIEDELARNKGSPSAAAGFGATKEKVEKTIKNELKPYTRDLDKLLARETVSEDVMVFRGCGRTFAKDLMEAGEVTEPGYMSVATMFESAAGFSRPGADGYRNILVFSRKKGSNGLYISKSENEIVVPRNTRLKLIGIRTADEVTYGGGKRAFKGELVRFLFVKAI